MKFSATTLLTKLTQRIDLSKEEAFSCAEALLSGEITDEQGAALLIGLKTKGETIDEIIGFSMALKKQAIKPLTHLKTFIDVCGTGGDQLKTFNISTTTAFVLAGCGLKVAKHGNRSVSSQSGSADVLSLLGVAMDLSPTEQGQNLDDIGISFLFAPSVHPGMKTIMPLRRALAIPTIFNVIGPLSNPLPLTYQVIGVYKQELLEPMIQGMRSLGVKSGAVVHGFGGMDELSLEGDNAVHMLLNGQILRTQVNAPDYGLKRALNTELMCSSVEESADLLLSVLRGNPGPHLDVVLLNAALALKIAGVVHTLEEGISYAKESILSKKALNALEKLTQKEYLHEQVG